MSVNLFFIDPLEKLNIKKDSSLMMAKVFQSEGVKSYILLEEDFYLVSPNTKSFKVYSFSAELEDDDCYLKSFKLGEQIEMSLNSNIVIHMRIDPPFDAKYLRYLWMLDFLRKQKGVKVVNDPIGIMNHNEKLLAYQQPDSAESFVGSSLEEAKKFVSAHSKVKEWILKPLDLYSGIGVSKHSSVEVLKVFPEKVKKLGGAIVLQPFQEAVYQGEVRSVYFKGSELGTILKTPPEGSYLSNIAQGAKFKRYDLPIKLKAKLEQIAIELLKDGLELIAFDVLGNVVTEINTTCPGLLVEVSKAYQENLVRKIIVKEFFD